MSTRNSTDEAFRRFLRRVWRDDVRPKLRDDRAAQRARTARFAGKAAGATGLFVDTILRLKGRPFGRAMTVMGASLGAILPDMWDWRWLRESASDAQRKFVGDRVRRRAATLPEADALDLFGLPPSATRDDLKHAWRSALQRWHPDKAPDDATRHEYHVRFLTYKAAYERLCEAYDNEQLPRK